MSPVLPLVAVLGSIVQFADYRFRIRAVGSGYVGRKRGKNDLCCFDQEKQTHQIEDNHQLFFVFLKSLIFNQSLFLYLEEAKISPLN